MLSSEGDNDDEDDTKEVRIWLVCHTVGNDLCTNLHSLLNAQKVTISTCHAAKGLEWPVVMVPGGMCSF